MADRKQFLRVDAADAELMRLLAATSDVVVSNEQLRAQRISFAFENAPLSSELTRESVVRAAETMRLRA